MPKIVNAPYLVHVVYEREAYGRGMVFDQDGHLRGVLSAESIARLRHSQRRRKATSPEPAYRIIDPREKRIFDEPWEIRAVDNFNRYFSRVFREGSPLVDSDQLFASHLWTVVDKPDAQCRILDLGAGGGRYTRSLVGRVVSLDLNASPPANRTHTSASAQQVTGTAWALPFRDASFHFVLCLFVLEHLANPFPVLDEICRVLKPAGRTILAVPSSGILQALRARYFGHCLTMPIHHLRSFGLVSYRFIESTRKLVARLQEAGCGAVHVRAVNAERLSPERRLGPKVLNSVFPFNFMGEQTIVIGTKGAAC